MTTRRMVDGRSTGFEAPHLYIDEEDYDSDVEVAIGSSLFQRYKNKLLSVIHDGWLYLDDEDGNYPHDPAYDPSTATPMLDELGDFLAEAEEVAVWCRQAHRVQESDAATWSRIYRTLTTASTPQRVIGPRAVLELQRLVDTWVSLYRGLHRAALADTLLVRRSRDSSAAGERHLRCVPTEPTTGEALLLRAEILQAALAAALELGA